MSRRPRRNHTPAFKWHLPPSRAIGHWRSLPSSSDVHPNQITSRKAQLESGAADVFGPGGGSAAQPAIDVKLLHAKIGELTLETIPKKRRHQPLAQEAGERSRMPRRADADC
jgi:transposase